MFSGANPVLDFDLGNNAPTVGCAGSGTKAKYDLSPGGSSPAPER
jgi:hypothetical protein